MAGLFCAAPIGPVGQLCRHFGRAPLRNSRQAGISRHGNDGRDARFTSGVSEQEWKENKAPNIRYVRASNNTAWESRNIFMMKRMTIERGVFHCLRTAHNTAEHGMATTGRMGFCSRTSGSLKKLCPLQHLGRFLFCFPGVMGAYAQRKSRMRWTTFPTSAGAVVRFFLYL